MDMRRGNLLLGCLNALGALIYLVRASHSWAIPEERGLNSATSEPFIWALYALPVLVVFAVVDLGWGVALLTRYGGGNGKQIYGATVLLWIVAIIVDFSKHP